MKYTLKRISTGRYDEFNEKVLSMLPNISALKINENLSDFVEEIYINEKTLEFDIDIDKINSFLRSDDDFSYSVPMQVADIKIAKYLYSVLTLESSIPTQLLYEKEVWAYLNCFVFMDLVLNRYFRFDGDMNNTKRVLRVILSDWNAIDRTGLRWLWSLADATYNSYYQFSLTETAIRFVDPSKALYERSLGLNRIVFKAFVRAIQLLKFDWRIKSEKYRSILVTHIRNLATLKIYEKYDSVEALAKIFAEDINSFITATS